MSYDMLAFDLDGTTITNTYQMSPSFVELIKEEKKHYYICIAPGDLFLMPIDIIDCLNWKR